MGFTTRSRTARRPLVVSGPSTPPGLNTIGFAEIYWADLAREIETAGYTLQETKEWCRSVVSRIRVLAERRSPGRSDIHYGQIEYVLEEAIDAIGTMESLLFLAKKAGVLDFDLNRMLDDYLGDVQLVTEFAGVRAKIVGRLHEALGNAHQLYPDAEIHVVAHSEGTVVAFLGLLEAATNPVSYPWIKQVRGLMTIGSPIDKHLILWPDLFTQFIGPGSGWSSASPSTRKTLRQRIASRRRLAPVRRPAHTLRSPQPSPDSASASAGSTTRTTATRSASSSIPRAGG